jgi:hypothetical protein
MSRATSEHLLRARVIGTMHDLLSLLDSTAISRRNVSPVFMTLLMVRLALAFLWAPFCRDLCRPFLLVSVSTII